MLIKTLKKVRNPSSQKKNTKNLTNISKLRLVNLT
jgi:hypothetical protein